MQITLAELANPTLGTIITLASNEESYRNSLRSAVRGLWKGELDYDLFFDAMISAIRMFLPRAWYEGAESVGIKPAELSPEEKVEIQRAVTSEISHIDALAQAVEENREAKGKLGSLFSRLKMWIGRFSDLRSRARLMAKTDPKLMWVMHPEKEHCASCLKLDGKVKRASYWKRAEVQPKNPPNEKLECGGWRCGCELVPTSLPATPGPLPALP